VLGAVYIADGWRTPFCRAGGALARSSPQALGVAVVRAFTDRGFASDSVDEIILGNVLNGRGNLARYAALGAGLPVTVPGCTIDRQCASGLEAVAQAYYRIGSRSAGSLMIAGGAESMSQAPFLMSRATRAFDRSPPSFLNVPLSPPEIGDPSMIETAELVAAETAIPRVEMDAFAVASHQKATAALREGRFRAELIPVATLDEAGRSRHVTTDLGPREDTSLPKLEALHPVVSGGTVTGNVMATERVHLLLTAVMCGDVIAPLVQVEEGVRFHGTCESEGRAKEKGSEEVRETVTQAPKVRVSHRGEAL